MRFLFRKFFPLRKIPKRKFVEKIKSGNKAKYRAQTIAYAIKEISGRIYVIYLGNNYITTFSRFARVLREFYNMIYFKF